MWILIGLAAVLVVLVIVWIILLHLRIHDLETWLAEAEQPREIMQAVVNETSVTVWDGEV